VVDAGNGFFQVALENAVELEALPRRDSQRAVGVIAGQPVNGEILSRSHFAPWNLAAHHEYILLAGLFLGALLAGIAIVLLIRAVKFEELLVLVVKVIAILQNFEGNGAAQVPAVFLDAFHRRALGGRLFPGFCWGDAGFLRHSRSRNRKIA